MKLGELFKMDYGVDVTNKIYTALRKIGFDKIFDLNFGADLTIMEEATELVNKIKNNDTNFPIPNSRVVITASMFLIPLLTISGLSASNFLAVQGIMVTYAWK